MLGIGKKKDIKTPKEVNVFIVDLSDFLVGYGFHVEDALKVAKDFYDKNKAKIKDTLTIF